MPSNRPVLPSKQNGMLWALLGILGVIAVGYFYTMPQIAKLKAVRTTAAARAADVLALEAQRQEILALNQQLDDRAGDLARLALAVPGAANMEELLVSLETIASTSGVVLASVQPVANAGAKGSEASVTLRGSYSGVKLFLELLAKNLRPVKVTELTLAGSSDVAGASLVDVTLTLVAADAVARSGGAASANPSAATEESGASNE
ncbi:type 4a pilus biogenesis protein PilO [Candidatus Berkelbacteria bacterium]|nr:type 4a pilus biogenesis protein PilO [Candidatus Berkelbacteria bacterium]